MSHRPSRTLPVGHAVDLPGRGRTWVSDTPGPGPAAPTLVLLHALGSTGAHGWHAALPVLRDRCRVVTLDLRGHGRGIRSDEVSLAANAHDVAALADALGLDRVLLGGYSLGGAVALQTWRHHPGRVAGLALAACGTHFRRDPLRRGAFAAAEVAMVGVRAAARGVTALGGSAALREWVRTPGRTALRYLPVLGEHDARGWLGTVDVPLSVVVTTRDTFVPAADQRRLVAGVPGATAHELAAGHAVAVTAPGRFVPAYDRAVGDVVARLPR